jgi:16S rRNA (guanine527-N7)-methyltransferase
MGLDTPRGGFAPLVERALGLGRAAAPANQVIARYLDELVVWNRKTDLTAARSVEELVDLTVGDAAVIAGGSEDSGDWIDVGAGAGAPGLVLAMLLPSIRMTLVEPKDRRVAFLRSVIGKLGLERVTVVRGRSDGLGAGAWDIALSRATLPPPLWLEEGARLARRAVWVLVARDEPPTLPGWRADADLRYELALTGASRRAVRYVVENVDGQRPLGEM